MINKRTIVTIGINLCIIGGMINLKTYFGWPGAAFGLLLLILFTYITNKKLVKQGFEYGYHLKDFKEEENND